MEIKVICQCGVKFAFDIEPVNGRMPCTIRCPSCDADATTQANAAIAEKLGATSPAPVAIPVAAPAQVARVMQVAKPLTATASAKPAEAEELGIQHCAKHAGEIAAAECFVCSKPICAKCMEQFGFLCSSYCKGQAQARKLDVPVFEGQVFQKEQKERRGQNFIIVGGIALASLALAFYIYYWFVLSRPKTAFKIETGPSTPFMHAEWVGDDRFFGVTPNRVTMFNAESGEEIWGVDLPTSPEMKGSKSGFSDEWVFPFEPTVKVVSKEIWIGLPNRVVRIESQSGKKKQELALPLPANDYQVGETHFLAVSSNPTNDAKLLTRINLSSGQMDSQWTPASAGARRVVGVTTLAPGVRNSSLARMDPNDDDFSDFSSTMFGRDRDYLFTGANVAHVTRQLIEERIAVQASTKPRTGPSIIDNQGARASQGLAAAEEFLNRNQPDTKIDQSLYSVTIRRFFGGAPAWTGQVSGRPHFFSSKTVDYLVAGNSLIVFNKNNQRLWEAKLTYSISPDYWDEEDTQGPAMELGSRFLFWDKGVLTAFDIKKGEVEWRVNSVGISGVSPDLEGNIYVNSTTAGPDQIKYERQVSLTDKVYPMIVKVELKTGKVFWQAARVGTDVKVSNGIVYTSASQISGMEAISASSRGESAPVNWRLYRLDPKTGKDVWEHHRVGVPKAVLPKGKRVILRYNDRLSMLEYM
jgi:outer membrane protein assembly factor BamB